VRSDEFPLPPKVTVTCMRGGGDFSMVPDHCEIDLDVRLTPLFHAAQAETEVLAVVADTAPDSAVTVHCAWPAYRLPDDSPLVLALADAAQQVLKTRPPAAVAGPANVGSLLAQHGVGPRIVRFLQYHAQCDDEQDETSSDAERGEIYAERFKHNLTDSNEDE
jgi:succinyl-diaminopimelate desuccinylase